MKHSIAELHSLLKNKEVTSVEITREYLQRIENEKLNIFITKVPEIAIERAEQADKRIKSGDMSIMTGIPVGIKDVFCTQNVRTTASSKMLSNFIPNYESTVTQKLRDCGAVMLGKTNMDEFAMGSANLNSYFGPTKNPWGLKNNIQKNIVPGGSSGASAAAVAHDLCPCSLGSDTGGSVRQPASFCGIVGVKPTYGRCSRWGMIAFASSLDQAGVFANTVEDAALLLQSICGCDNKDETSKNIENFKVNLNSDLSGKRIGIPVEYQIDGIPDEINDMWVKSAKWLEEAGAKTVEISLPHTEYALPAYYVIAPAEASSNLARYDGVRYGVRIPGNTIDEMYKMTRAECFGKEVKRRILIGTYVLSSIHYESFYKKAQLVRHLITKDFHDAFKNVDAILTPTTPTEPFSMNEKPDPLMMYINDIFTVPVNLAGLPAISVPSMLSKDGLPLGLQVISNSFQEEVMFNVAKAIEEKASFEKLSNKWS